MLIFGTARPCDQTGLIIPNGDNHDRTDIQYLILIRCGPCVPCRFLPPPTPMALYQTISRDEHELTPSVAPEQNDSLTNLYDPFNDRSRDEQEVPPFSDPEDPLHNPNPYDPYNVENINMGQYNDENNMVSSQP